MKFCEGSRVQQTPEEGWTTYRPKCCGNKDEDPLFKLFRFFSLSLMLLGGWIGNLYNGYFVGEFALLGVVRDGVVDPTCVFV